MSAAGTPGASARVGGSSAVRQGGRSHGVIHGTAQSVDRLLGTVPFYPLLLAAYPVLLLYSNNVTEVDGGEVLAPLLLVVAASAIGLALLSFLWGSARRAAIVTAMVVLPALSFGLIATALAPLWPDDPIVRTYLTLAMVWLAAFFVSVSLAARLKGRLATVTQALNLVSIALIGLAVVPILSYVIATTGQAPAGTAASPAGAAVVSAAGRPDGVQRDIYHFVFDRYGSDESLRTGLGIDNEPFSEWLTSRGFKIGQDARANYERTTLSLSSVLSMSLLEELAERMGADNPDYSPIYQRLRNSSGAAYLQGLGYRYLHVGSWFHPTAKSDIADLVEGPAFEVSFATTLRDNSALPALDALVSMASNLSTDPGRERQALATSTQFERVAALAEQPGPKLVFAHFLVPHEPYVFLEDGTFDPDEATYETQLRYANAQIKSLIEPLLALPADEQPIIILQADEGPYPSRYAKDRDRFDWTTATPEELVTKFGVLNAMYLPGPEGEAPLRSGMSLVNTYPELLRRYFDADIPDLPDRSYALSNGAPYDQTDITARLNEAFGDLPDAD